LHRYIPAQKLDDLDGPNIANLAWAFSKAAEKGAYSDAELFAGLARVAQQKVSDFNAQDMANVAWTFANAGRVGTFHARYFAVTTPNDDMTPSMST
jgi:hypothetical protein